jgi:glutamate receptor, ionotropic, invertebrate
MIMPVSLAHLFQDPKQSNALNLVNVAGIFYILIGGLVLAIVIAVLEFLVKASRQARKGKVSAGCNADIHGLTVEHVFPPPLSLSLYV